MVLTAASDSPDVAGGELRLKRSGISVYGKREHGTGEATWQLDDKKKNFGEG